MNPTIACLVLLISLIPAALAQAEPHAQVLAKSSATTLAPGQGARLSWEVHNPAPLDASASLVLRLPKGWSGGLAAEDRTFSLRASETRVVSVEVSPEAVGALNGSAELTMRVTDAAGRSDEASAKVPLNFQPPALAASPPAPVDHSVRNWSLGLGLPTLFGLALYAAQTRSVRLRPRRPLHAINAGTSGVYHIAVSNLAPYRQRVALRVRGLPSGWAAALNVPHVQLSARESLEVPLYVRVPADAAQGSAAQLRVEARSNRLSPWLVREPVEAAVIDVAIPSGTPGA